MTRNFVIAAVSVTIIVFNIHVFSKWKKVSKTVKIISLIVLFLWLVTTGMPNMHYLWSPFMTEPVNGTVIDAETLKPVASCNVKAAWILETISIAGGHWGGYHQYTVKTNDQGEFRIPSYQKALGVYGLFPLIAIHDHGMEIVAYSHGYKARQVFAGVTEMKPLRDPAEYVENVFQLGNKMTFMNDYEPINRDDKEYLAHEAVLFDSRFPNLGNTIQKRDRHLPQLAVFLEGLGEYQKAIDLWKKDLVVPGEAVYATQEILRLHKRQQDSFAGALP